VEEVIKTIYTYYHTIDITILHIGAGQTGNSYWSVGGGGGRTAIQLTSGVDAVVAGGGGGGGACFKGALINYCSGISGTYITHFFTCDREPLVDVFLF